MTACTGADEHGCDRPARGPVDEQTVDGVTVPAHTCRQCAEHCQMRAYLILRETHRARWAPAPLLRSQSGRRWRLGTSSDGTAPTRATADRIAEQLGWTLEDQ